MKNEFHTRSDFTYVLLFSEITFKMADNKPHHVYTEVYNLSLSVEYTKDQSEEIYKNLDNITQLNPGTCITRVNIANF